MDDHRPDGLPRIERLTSAEAASRGGFKDKTTSVVVGDPARFRHFDLYVSTALHLLLLMPLLGSGGQCRQRPAGSGLPSSDEHAGVADVYQWEAGTAPGLVPVCSRGSDSASAPVSDHDGSVQPGHNGSAELAGQMSASETAFGTAGSDSTEIWNVEAVLTDEAGSRGYERVVWHLV